MRPAALPANESSRKFVRHDFAQHGVGVGKPGLTADSFVEIAPHAGTTEPGKAVCDDPGYSMPQSGASLNKDTSGPY